MTNLPRRCILRTSHPRLEQAPPQDERGSPLNMPRGRLLTGLPGEFRICAGQAKAARPICGLPEFDSLERDFQIEDDN